MPLHAADRLVDMDFQVCLFDNGYYALYRGEVFTVCNSRRAYTACRQHRDRVHTGGHYRCGDCCYSP